MVVRLSSSTVDVVVVTNPSQALRLTGSDHSSFSYSGPCYRHRLCTMSSSLYVVRGVMEAALGCVDSPTMSSDLMKIVNEGGWVGRR